MSGLRLLFNVLEGIAVVLREEVIDSLSVCRRDSTLLNEVIPLYNAIGVLGTQSQPTRG
jgi:hypothetical protein